MSDSGKRAYQRYRFKNSTCFKTCMLHTSKGGFCGAAKDQIEHCLVEENIKKDGRDYRSVENTLEWLEILSGDKVVPVTPALRQQIADSLLTTRRDCCTIAEKILEGICPLVQLSVS